MNPRAPWMPDPGRVGRALALAICALVLCHMAGVVLRIGFGHDRVRGFVPFFDLGGELNAPAIFSTLMLAAAGGLLGLIATEARGRREPWRTWAALSVVFAFLAVDELLQIHERLNAPGMPSFASPFLSWPWVVWYGLSAAVLGLLLVPFFRKLPRATLVRFLGAAALYVGGALGFEMLGAAEYARHGVTDWHYAGLYTLEETFEMAGAAFFIYALVVHRTEETEARA